MTVQFSNILTISLTLFAVIDMIGSVPLLISLRSRIGHINPWKVTLASAVLMIGFLFVGEQFLKYLGIDRASFATAGSIVMFILGLEMVLGIEFFKSDPSAPAGSVVPIAFPIIAGSGTLTTIMSLKTVYQEFEILIGITMNLIFIFLVVYGTKFLEKWLGKAFLLTIRKFFGVILIAIAVKIFKLNN